MYKIAIDLGYGYVKGLNEDGERIIYPSVVGTAHQRQLKNLFGHSQDKKLDNLQVHVKAGNLKGEFFVGNLAFDSRAKSYAFSSNKNSHENTIVNLATSAALLAGSNEDILLVTGLPLQFYKDQRREFTQFLNTFDAQVIIRSEKREVMQNIQFGRTAVFPQAAGSIYDAILEYPYLSQQRGSLVAVVDIGFRTTDYIVIRVASPIETIETLSGTIEMGMSHLNKVFAESYFAETGKQADFAQVTRYISNGGRFYFNGREHDLSGPLEVARTELAKTIKDDLVTVWGDSYQEFRAITLVGGGCGYVGNTPVLSKQLWSFWVTPVFGCYPQIQLCGIIHRPGLSNSSCCQ